MPRRVRTESKTGIYHFINRGVIKRPLFHCAWDYGFYYDLLLEYAARYGIRVYHYCLMPNHTHLLVQAANKESVSSFGHFVQRLYAYYFRKKYNWKEQIFRKRFFCNPVEDETYLLECGRYIERNPLRAGLVCSPGEYSYSSYRHYAEGKKDRLLVPSPAFQALSEHDEIRRLIYQNYVLQERGDLNVLKRICEKPKSMKSFA